MAPVPGYSDIGKAVNDVLKGSAKSGAFQLDNKVTYSGSTSTGLNATLSAVAVGDKVLPTLKAAYAKAGYSADCTFDGSSQKVALSTAAANVMLPGLRLSGNVTLPDTNSAKFQAEYAFPFLTTKATVQLTSSPVLELVASTGLKDIVVGVEVAFDTAKNMVSKHNVAVGYHAPDFQMAISILDKLQTVKVGYTHNVNPTTRVAAEINRKLASGDTSVTLGYAKLLASGASAKFKIDNTGLLSALYETKLTSGEKVASSFQLFATDLSKPLKYGFAVDLS
eukprot:CAMPEP_0119108626 /NCGR_PEP_ID=MMETSP1180-20130426/15514_1 /TAXON_ID=3052 ORGANISM="Chlamydomonas cf sp, Strain CCMP681" /NCGR_SAMPLE_ID=MMETSP1180 /ASSEMBLY_ACC=CAM_ASM_000741 /LENGTH=279 /DNA_ID=CAMNT_0007094261 /DNA_START=47 /DNA_END=886 /DNA_ORIENTATION=+